MISTFKSEYSFLSNFHPSNMKLDLGSELGLWSINNVEEVYQAAKAKRNDQAIWVLQSASPGIAKRRGREIEVIDDWDQIKTSVMKWAVTEKFKQNKDLAQLLIDTGDQHLCEGNYWHDNYWGNCTCKKCQGITGQNMLGKILMEIRDELRTPTPPA